MPSSIHDIELHHESVRDIIGTPPNWIISWGETIFLVIILFALTTTIFVRYPETLKGDFNIVKNENDLLLGELSLGQFNFGKVQEGNEVLISLQSYSKEEFGLIEGTVVSIGKQAVDDEFILTIDLSSGREDIDKKGIVLREGMKGDGQVVLSNDRLISKFMKRKI